MQRRLEVAREQLEAQAKSTLFIFTNAFAHFVFFSISESFDACFRIVFSIHIHFNFCIKCFVILKTFPKMKIVQGMSTRKFAMKYCTSDVADVMIDLCQIAPDDPVISFCEALDKKAQAKIKRN